MWNWFELFSLTEFLETELVGRTMRFNLEDVGTKDVIITQGNTTAITVDGVFLPINFNAENPYIREDIGVYLDADNVVWLGYEEEE